MKAFSRLNFPSYKFKVRRSDSGEIYVWDIIRNKWLLLTPEEWVRQHMIYWLTGELNIPRTSIVCEYAVSVNGLPQRADIVVFSGLKPCIIIECKASSIGIDKSVFAQVTRYNYVVYADYVMITNGLKTLCFESNGGNYKQISLSDIVLK